MITFHGVPISVHTRKAIVTAMHKGIDHKVEPVIPFNPPANWAALSPTGLIPVMDDAGFLLPDSSAICQYLDIKHPAVPVLPEDVKQRARALWFDAYAGGTIFRGLVQGLFVQKVIRPNILKQPTDQSAIDSILTDTQPKVFGYLEDELAGDFLVGGSLTLADIAIASNLINFQYLGYTIDRGRYPKLAGFAAAIVRQPSFQRALAAEKPYAEGMGLDRSFLDA